MCVRVCVDTCEGQKEALGLFLGCAPPYFLRWVLKLSLKLPDLARLARQEAPGSISPVPGLLVLVLVPRFYEDSADPNSDPQACAVGT